MRHNELSQLLTSISAAIEDDKKIFIPNMSSKLQKIAEAHPKDQTILAMTNVIESMGNEKLFISKKEVKDLYKKFYSRNNKFAEYFKEELGDLNYQPNIKTTSSNNTPIESLSVSNLDPILVNALNTAMGSNTTVNLYDKKTAEKAEKYVMSSLDNWNVKPVSVKTDAGNDKFIIVKANYETPKGLTSFIVPVEIKNSKVLEPSIFVANAGPIDINHINVKSYITSNAGSKLKLSSNQILHTLSKLGEEDKEITSLELALTRIKAAEESIAEPNQIVGIKVAEIAKKDVELPKLNETSYFEEKFGTDAGFANFKFGSDKINLGRNVIARKLQEFGFKNAQVSVLNCDNDTVFYAASVSTNNNTFKIPVKIANSKVLEPEFLLCNGSILPFDKKSVDDLFANNQTDYKVAAKVSPNYALKPGELIEIVKSAVAEQNLAKAEDALNILQQSDYDIAYKTAFAYYIDGLSNKKVEAQPSKCSLIVKNSTSMKPLCGHTNLPLDKVYQDEFGNCRPMYRKNSKESYDGAYFMNSKIFG